MTNKDGKVGPDGYNPLWDDYDQHIGYYDKQGKQISLREYCELFDWNYKRVALTELEAWGGLSVSTVWLGLNHNFRPGGTPLIFETMVFCSNHDAAVDLDCRRYATEEQALAGHAEIVAGIEKEWDAVVAGDNKTVKEHE